MTAAFLDAAAAGLKRKRTSNAENQKKKERKVSYRTTHNSRISSSSGTCTSIDTDSVEEEEAMNEVVRDRGSSVVSSKKGKGKGKAWSQDDQDLLKEKTKHFESGYAQNKDFEEIAEFFPNRTAGSCYSYYKHNLMRGGVVVERAVCPRDWTKYEHDLLKEKTKHFNGEYAPLNESRNEFDEIVEFFPNRTALACHARYNNHFKKEGAERAAHPKHVLLKEKTTYFDGGHAAHEKFKENAKEKKREKTKKEKEKEEVHEEEGGTFGRRFKCNVRGHSYEHKRAYFR
jgi:hypothetical protein